MENAGAGDATDGEIATPNGQTSPSRENAEESDHMIIDSETPATAVTANETNGTNGTNGKGGLSEKEESNGPEKSNVPNGTREIKSSTPENERKNGESSDSAKPADITKKRINGQGSYEPRMSLHTPSIASTSTPSKRAPTSLKVEKEISRLQQAVDEVSPEAARKILHANWRKFLFEDIDDMHVIFVLRALLKNCNGGVMERIAKDGNLFKGNILKAAGRNEAVINQVFENQEVFDQACADRITKVDAKVLLGWLAKGGRLGYTEKDVIEVNGWVHPDTQNAAEDVIMLDSRPAMNGFNRPGPPIFKAPLPSHPPPPANHVQHQLLPPAAPQAVLPAPGGPMVCNHCNKVFNHVSGFNYHHLKKVCTKEPPATGWKWTCEFCFQGFTTKQGREYHNLKKVCETCDIPPATPLTAAPRANFQLNPVPSSAPTPPGPPVYAGPFSGPPPAPPGTMAVVVPLPSNTITRPPLYTPVNNQFATNNSVASSQPANVRSGTIPRPPLRTPSTATPPVPPTPTAVGSNPPSSTSAPTNNPDPVVNSSTSRPTRSAQIPFSTPNQSVSHPSTPRSGTPHTGTRKQAPHPDIRQSPSELSAERKAQLDSELAAEDARYEVARVQAMSLTEPEKTTRLTSLKNGNASKKSTIRKRYGVSLRLREKDKLAAKASTNRLRSEDSKQHNTIAQPTTGFSPINTIVSAPTVVSAPSGFSPINVVRTVSSPVPNYGSPYAATANSNQSRPSIPATNGFSSPNPVPGYSASRLSSSRRSSEQGTPEGFGVLVRRDSRTTRYAPQNQMTPTTYAATHKRRRGSQSEDEGAARPSPGPPSHNYGTQLGPAGNPSYRTPYGHSSSSNLSSASRPGSSHSHPPGSAQAAIQENREKKDGGEENKGKEVASASRESTPASDAEMGGVSISAPGVDDVVPTTEKAPPAQAPQVVELSSDDDSDDEDIPA